jgi:hypothetical protein
MRTLHCRSDAAKSVNSSTVATKTALIKALDNLVIIGLQTDNAVELDTELFKKDVKRLRLRERSRKTVKNEIALRFIGLEHLFDKSDYDIVGNKIPGFHK